jgi:gamma-glutamyl:cysteine ligase YbdK (ATP-grasp superfamily)
VGQEIKTLVFDARQVDEFTRRLARETALLAERARQSGLSMQGPVAGLELEACLIDGDCAPAPVNISVLRAMNEPLAAPELARFNVEFNTHPRALAGRALSALQHELETIWARGATAAHAYGARLVSIGILPTLAARHLTLDGLTPMNRYAALNEQLMRSRDGRPLRLDIRGRERLVMAHDNMMLEAAGTSLQLHLQAPFDRIHHLYNAALAVSAPLLAAGANSPYLFGADLWDESRMPLFEQSLEVGDFGGQYPAPLRRVSLGSGYARASILERFEENLRDFPVLLPELFDDAPETFPHLRLHNGTVWRWVRPLVGFDGDGTPHLRIEQRVLSASPSLIDAVADAALCYGLLEVLSRKAVSLERRLPYAQAADNFQQAARHGLGAHLVWLDGKRIEARALLLETLLPLARQGLHDLGLDAADCDRYLATVEQRVQSGCNGAVWQRSFIARHGRDLRALTAAYAARQQSGAPVHTWSL